MSDSAATGPDRKIRGEAGGPVGFAAGAMANKWPPPKKVQHVSERDNSCAFCGQENSEGAADLMREFHETFTLLVLADYGTPEYEAHLVEARRILDVEHA